MKIGIFDSGIGGLNVLNALKKTYPNIDYIYYGDTKNVPYGNKSKEEIYELSKKIIEFLISQNVDLIIIACGTISSNCYNELKKHYDIPIYDIISPTIDYINNSNIKSLGVIGTYRTITSGIFESNLNIETTSIACIDFVPLIENKETNKDLIMNSIQKYFNVFKNIDALVLGCTHYPYLINYFKEYFDYELEFIDMGVILTKSLRLNNIGNSTTKYYFSKLNDNIKTLVDNYILKEV